MTSYRKVKSVVDSENELRRFAGRPRKRERERKLFGLERKVEEKRRREDPLGGVGQGESPKVPVLPRGENITRSFNIL